MISIDNSIPTCFGVKSPGRKGAGSFKPEGKVKGPQRKEGQKKSLKKAKTTRHWEAKLWTQRYKETKTGRS